MNSSDTDSAQEIVNKLISSASQVNWLKALIQGESKIAELALPPQAAEQSQFSLLFKFNLSENITEVRVSKRKTWTSTLAEILAFIAGLSFQAKLVKYLMTLNRVGRYYDKAYARAQNEEGTKLIIQEGDSQYQTEYRSDPSSQREIQLGQVNPRR